jgi:putative oxidoreductase
MVKTIIAEKQGARKFNWFLVLRVILGLILIYKATTFIRNATVAQTLIERTGIGFFSKNADTFSLMVTSLSMLCGAFIVAGLLTRIASIIQIPILLVAVFFINMRNVGEGGFELLLSIFTLFLLFLFAVKGSGKPSFDNYFRRGAVIDEKNKEESELHDGSIKI